MALIAKNDVARKVMDHLPASRQIEGGYFGGSTYCMGVPVRSIAEAFELGAAMGAEATGFGDIGFDKIGTQQYVVFRSANVAQGAALDDKPRRPACGM